MLTISSRALKPRLTEGSEIAFLDVREHGQYGEGHPFFSVSLPYSVMEGRAPILLPCKEVAIVVMDDGDGVSPKAAAVLKQLNYRDVSVLEDGAPGWVAAGFTLFKGVNVPSKTFGELVEHHADTPSISAQDLKTRLENDEPLIVLDGRSPQEFGKMSLPAARSCPNAELAYRLPHLTTDADTPIIINCAGRTRSIIGAETLRQCGVPNPVFSLRNGTQGWRLAGFDLENGTTPDQLPALSPEQQVRSSNQARELIERWHLDFITPDTLEAWQADSSRSTYLLDVRTAEEYANAHWPGARHAPGGQLVQATDEHVAVRGARIVLCDDTGLRAATTAMWLRGMGHNVSILNAAVFDGSTSADTPTGTKTCADGILPHEAAGEVKKSAFLLDASCGMDHRAGHPQGALWVTRAQLGRLPLNKDVKIIVTGQNLLLISGIVIDLAQAGYTDICWFEGSHKIWQEAGFNVIATPHSPSDTDCIDYLFFVHDRHDGNLDAARQYLAWETGLLEQLDEQERGILNPPTPYSASI